MKQLRIAEQVSVTEAARISLLKTVDHHARIYGRSYTETSFYTLMIKSFVDKHHEELVNLINVEAERDAAQREVVKLKVGAAIDKKVYWSIIGIMFLAIVALTYTR